MSFAVKYRLTFYDSFGAEIRLEILKDGYSGAVNELVGAADPVVYGYEKNGDALFEPIKSTIVTINLLVKIAGTYDEFYEIGSKEYQVKIYRSGVCFWTGWLNDEIFQEDYSPGFYAISLTATDGLVFLKSKQTALTGRQTHFAIVKEALDEIGLGINIVDAINIFEDSHDRNDGPLKQTMFDTDLFSDSNKRYTLTQTLTDVLFTYGARIVQHENRWVICSVESLFAGLTGYEYTSAGAFSGAFSFDDSKVIDIQSDSTHVCLLTNGNIQKNKAWKQLATKQILGKVKSTTVLNGNFSDLPDYENNSYFKKVANWLYSDGSQVVIDPNDENYSTISIKSCESTGNYLFIENNSDETAIHSDISSSPVIAADSTKEYIFSLKYAALQSGNGDHFWYTRIKVEAVNGSTINYLKYDSASSAWAWSVTNSDIVIGGDGTRNGGGVPQQNENGFKWHDLTAETVGFPGGKIRVTIYSEYKFLALNYKGFAFDEISFFAKEIDNTIGYVYKTGSNSGDFSFVPDQLDFLQNDVPYSDATNIPLFYKNYMSLLTGEPTSSWTSGEGYTGYLSDIYLKSILNQYSRGTLLKSFSLVGIGLTPNTSLVDEKGRVFTLISFTGSLKDNQYSVEAFEMVEPNTATITISSTHYNEDPEKEKGESSSTTSTGSTGAGSGDHLVAMLNDSGIETGPAGRLQDKSFHVEFFGSLPTYVSNGAGWGLKDAYNDFQEVIFGNYPTISDGDAATWVDTDRLMAVGNGVDSNNRSDALTVYKSGLAIHSNAVGLGAYSHGTVDPVAGLLQYTAGSFQGHNGVDWKTFAMTSDLHSALTIGTGNGLYLTSGIQELNLLTASASTTGALTAADWTTFNAKWTLSGVNVYHSNNVSIGGANFTYTLGIFKNSSNTSNYGYSGNPALFISNLNGSVLNIKSEIIMSTNAGSNLAAISCIYDKYVGSGSIASALVFSIQKTGIANLSQVAKIDRNGVGINNMTPAYSLDVTGDINTTTMYRVGAAQVFTAPLLSGSAGSAGQVLTSTGASSAPSWQTITGTGTVTSVAAGVGMSFTTITGSGSVTLGTPSNITSSSTNSATTGTHTHALDATGVVAGSYSLATITVDAKGRITGASSGAAAGTVTSVSAGAGMSFTTITGSGSVIMGTPSTITNATTNSVSTGTHSHALTLPVASSSAVGCVQIYASDGGLKMSGNYLLASDLQLTTRSPEATDYIGFYDVSAAAQGNCTIATLLGLTAPANITSSSTNSQGSSSHTHALDNTGVTAGSYSLATITVDAKGRITAASNLSTISIYEINVTNLATIYCLNTGPILANSSFYMFSSSLDTYLIHQNGSFTPATMSDSAAYPSSLYYSSTQSKLCWKDSSYIVHTLY